MQGQGQKIITETYSHNHCKSFCGMFVYLKLCIRKKIDEMAFGIGVQKVKGTERLPNEILKTKIKIVS